MGESLTDNERRKKKEQNCMIQRKDSIQFGGRKKKGGTSEGKETGRDAKEKEWKGAGKGKGDSLVELKRATGPSGNDTHLQENSFWKKGHKKRDSKHPRQKLCVRTRRRRASEPKTEIRKRGKEIGVSPQRSIKCLMESGTEKSGLRGKGGGGALGREKGSGLKILRGGPIKGTPETTN